MRKLISSILLLSLTILAYAIDPQTYIHFKATKGSFPIAGNGKAATIYVSPEDHAGVIRVAGHFQNDIYKVSGVQPKLIQQNGITDSKPVIIIGSLDKSPIIRGLINAGKLNEPELSGKWEKFIVQTIENPLPNVASALVIVGSDKRGTIFGMYDVSEEIGVNPWHFWADIPPQKHSELYVEPGLHTKGEPKVKYRGIFINDEAPALSGWAFSTYGGFNSQFYDKVFELILRMKGNYLWPAMWGRMFYVEDPQNPVLAEEYGIVMGTSHHEPLTRAHAEWARFGKGDWNYNTNPEVLEDFWRKGMERRGDTETIVSIGMRGDGDEPMTEGTAIELLENIVKKQREIIEETTGKPASETPQLWALYKEVQDYYDKGMRVPDDVTLLLCDDNWGNIRKLPEIDAAPRSGGYGIYYHFDYVGGPRNYKWLNTNQIERTWEQMHLAYEYGVDRIWIVNVGDIKPMEFPTQFFLDYAWNPDAWNANNLMDYYTLWAKDVFGEEHAEEIGEMVRLYTKYNARRKPELIDKNTYSLVHFNEADQIVDEYNQLASKAEKLNNLVPKELKDAYYQLVLFPIQASANLNELYVAAAKNNWYAEQGRARTNYYAEKVQELFQRDQELTDQYHKDLAGGKWNHMMSQTHIGYTYWQQPDQNNIPETKTIEVPEQASMGVAIDGSTEWWPVSTRIAALPTFDSFNNQSYQITIFNQGKEPFDFKVETEDDWIIVDRSGTVDDQSTLNVQIDWKKAPEGSTESTLKVIGTGKEVEIKVPTQNLKKAGIHGFIEANGFISIEAQNYSKAINEGNKEWISIPNLGKTGSAVTITPVKQAPAIITEKSPRLEYNVHLLNAGEVKVHAYFAPTINYTVREGLKYGIGFNNEKPQIINVHKDSSERNWNSSVADNIKVISSTHSISEAGNHVLKFYQVDAGLVLEKIVIETAGLPHTYLGPPESPHRK